MSTLAFVLSDVESMCMTSLLEDLAKMLACQSADGHRRRPEMLIQIGIAQSLILALWPPKVRMHLGNTLTFRYQTCVLLLL